MDKKNNNECHNVDINRGLEATMCLNYDTVVQPVETGIQERMLSNRLRFTKPTVGLRIKWRDSEITQDFQFGKV